MDQSSKIWVKIHMIEGDVYEIFSWFKIRFLENEGMAYGITLFSKLLLTLFRIVAMSGASYVLYKLIRTRTYGLGFLMALSLVVAGGIGNIIDCVFYGEVFSSSQGQLADFVSWGMGYGELFYGKVVDMLHFPLIDTVYPEWFPIYGGERFVFFSPVFNIADSYISVGVALLLLFYPRTFSKMLENIGSKKDTEASNSEVVN